MRLFCFPYAGGSAQIHRQWGKALPQEVDVCSVQLPGRGNRLAEPAYTRLPQLVEACLEGLGSFFDRPFAFFGHSMGAMISFELTRLLRRNKRQLPAQIFLSGRTAPEFSNDAKKTYDLPDPEFIAELKNLNGTPQELLANEELMQLMLPILRADFEICQTYEYVDESPLDRPISVYGGLEDEYIGRDEFDAWRSQTTSHFILKMFAGGHFFLHSAEDLLLRVLAAELEELLSTIR